MNHYHEKFHLIYCLFTGSGQLVSCSKEDLSLKLCTQSIQIHFQVQGFQDLKRIKIAVDD